MKPAPVFQKPVLDKETVLAHLRKAYQGVFSASGLEAHYRDYVELTAGRTLFDRFRDLAGLDPGKVLLDLGCGFGSFVLVCRGAGLEARGIDLAGFELEFARQRLARMDHGISPEEVYLEGDARETGLAPGSFDLVTAWNLLEHVEDYRLVVREAFRLLKPGGQFWVLAPNYLAFRREPHYGVPWLPLLPRGLAGRYLAWLDKNPAYFRSSVFPLTGWGLLTALRRAGFKLIDPNWLKIKRPELASSQGWRTITSTAARLGLTSVLKPAATAIRLNPFRPDLFFGGRKPG